MLVTGTTTDGLDDVKHAFEKFSLKDDWTAEWSQIHEILADLVNKGLLASKAKTLAASDSVVRFSGFCRLAWSQMIMHRSKESDTVATRSDGRASSGWSRSRIAAFT